MLRSSILTSSSSDSSRPRAAKSWLFAIASRRFFFLSSFAFKASSCSFSFLASSAYFFLFAFSASAFCSSVSSSSSPSGFSSTGGGGRFIKGRPRVSRIQGMNFQDGNGFPYLISSISCWLKPILDMFGTTLFGV